MKITQVESGNILIKDNQDRMIAAMPQIYVFVHPRKQNTILINGSGSPRDEMNSIEGNLDLGIFIGDTNHFKVSSFFADLQEKIVLNGSKAIVSGSTDTSPIRAEFDSITDYEIMYLFTKQYSKTVNPIKKDETGKIIEEEYLLQFTDSIARIKLTYYYLSGNQISHILMSGTTHNINLPIKTYIYDQEGNVSHTYEEVTWNRYSNAN